MKMDVNEETDILDRLGILDSKLECPNKQFPSPKSKGSSKQMATTNSQTKATIPSSSSAPALEPGDGWSGLSLDEESVNSSSDDSDCLFDHRKDRTTINGDGNGNCRRKLRRNRRTRADLGAGVPNCWKLIALLSAAAFMGFSMSLSHRKLSSTDNNNSQTFLATSNLFRFVAIHALSLWIGSMFASSALIRVNPFSVFLALMLIFVCVCVQIQMAQAVDDVPSIGQSVLLFLCAAQAFVAGAIERGILLMSPLWNIRIHRTMFLAYAVMAFSAGGSFLLQHNSHLSMLSSLPQVPQFSYPSAPIELDRRAILPENGTTTDVPSFLDLNSGKNDQKTDANNSMSDQNLRNGSVENSTKSAVEPQKEPREFKTKTEENQFRRKEQQELKRKKEKEAEQKSTTDTLTTTTTSMPTTTTTPTTTSTSTTTTTTPPPTTTTTTTTTTTPMTTTKEVHHSIPTTTAVSRNTQINGSSPVPSFRLFSTAQLIVLCALILPILLGFCCCCALDHPICSTQYKHLAKLLAPPSAHSEPLMCHVLSMSICAIHAALCALLELSMSESAISIPFGSLHIPPASIFWASLSVGRLIFVIRPSFATKSASLHSLYFISIFSCAVLHFSLTSSPFTTLSGFALSGFSAANIPLLLFTWQCASAHSSMLMASGRFITAMAFGKLAGPTVFAWWKGNGGQLPLEALVPTSVFFVSFGMLSVSYSLFLLLLTKLRRNQRQQQISQLSGALNGQSQRPPKRKAQSTRKTKGPYRALLTSTTGGRGESQSNLSLAGLDSSSDESEAFELEMDSVGEATEIIGPSGQSFERRTKAKKMGHHREEDDSSSVDDLV